MASLVGLLTVGCSHDPGQVSVIKSVEQQAEVIAGGAGIRVLAWSESDLGNGPVRVAWVRTGEHARELQTFLTVNGVDVEAREVVRVVVGRGSTEDPLEERR